MVRASIPTLIKQMLKPDFYPHPVSKKIQLVQTHISYVLLTGDYAYKVKKTVNFGFLDFSTLEKRSHFCQEELRLNFMGAAQLYLEVLPITQDGEQYDLGGTKEPVEYALKMHQFPQEGLLSTMLEQKKLSESDVEELGKVVARYHNQTVTNDYIRSFGEVDKVRCSIDENYELTSKYIGKAQTETQYKETKAYTDRFFTQHPQLFVNRIKNDCIRECHGDLHLRNICIWHSQILLFDCIEFKSKPVNIPKITILLDNGYHPEKLQEELTKIHPQIMTKIRFKLSPKPSKTQKEKEGKTGFVPVKARWVIERTNSA